MTETAFIKKRRTSAPASSSGSQSKVSLKWEDFNVDLDELSNEQVQLLFKQPQKERAMKVAAHMENSLLEGEVTQDIREGAEAEVAARFRRERDREARKRRVAAAVAKDDLGPRLKNQNVYFVDVSETDARELSRVITSPEHQCTVVSRRGDAQVLVCKDPDASGGRALWHAVLHGCYVPIRGIKKLHMREFKRMRYHKLNGNAGMLLS